MIRENGKKILLNVDMSWSYGSDFLKGFIKYSQIYTNWKLIESKPFYLRKHSTLAKKTNQADCIITALVERDKIDKEIFENKHAIIFPTGVNPVKNAINIRTDDLEIGNMAAQYFINKGYLHFAFFGYPLMEWSASRGKSFIDRVVKEKHNIHCFELTKPIVNKQIESRYVSQWLDALPKPVAVFCCNDDRARDLLEVATDLGLKVPDSVSLLGVDNNEYICNLTSPSLSSIELNTRLSGYKAAKILEEAFNKNEFKSKTIWVKPTRIIPRESTDHFAVDDKSLIDAMSYIKANEREMIQAVDVADYVCLSRRHLDHKFINKLGVTLSQHIKKVKINIICQMLLETHENISEIAYKVGFNEIDHFSRFFRSQMGMSPSQYRSKNR